MTMIQKNSIVGLTRTLDERLSKGLVGMITQCHDDRFEVKFPIQGQDDVYAWVQPEDIKLLLGDPNNS